MKRARYVWTLSRYLGRTTGITSQQNGFQLSVMCCDTKTQLISLVYHNRRKRRITFFQMISVLPPRKVFCLFVFCVLFLFDSVKRFKFIGHFSPFIVSRANKITRSENFRRNSFFAGYQPCVSQSNSSEILTHEHFVSDRLPSLCTSTRHALSSSSLWTWQPEVNPLVESTAFMSAV